MADQENPVNAQKQNVTMDLLDNLNIFNELQILHIGKKNILL